MNYEEKYKQSLERAKKLYEQGTITESLGYVFPELVEDEDERIRKKLICFVENWEKGYNPDSPFDDYAIYTSDRDELDRILAWLEKQGKKLDPDNVIEWLKHRELSCDDVVITVIPDDSPTSVPHKVKWLSDEFVKQFKKDFGI